MGKSGILTHTPWECKYHVVFIRKCRKKELYGTLRKYLGDMFWGLAQQRESKIEDGHLCSNHVHMLISILPKYSVSEVVGFVKGKSAIYNSSKFYGTPSKLRRSDFWGTRLLRFDSWSRRGHDVRIRSKSRS
jgi:putative transposase